MWDKNLSTGLQGELLFRKVILKSFKYVFLFKHLVVLSSSQKGKTKTDGNDYERKRKQDFWIHWNQNRKLHIKQQ